MPTLLATIIGTYFERIIIYFDLKWLLSLFWNLEGYRQFMFFLPLFPFFRVFYFSLPTVYFQLLASKREGACVLCYVGILIV